jgi:3-oxoacyl-[acyl-carrier protein] reductase
LAAELPSAIGVGVDLTSEHGPATLHSAAVSAFGRVDILVLNGPGPKPGSASDTSAEDIEDAVRALVLPQQRLVSTVLPSMTEQGWGRILAVGSSGVVAPIPNLVLSNIGRAALAGYLKTLATEVASSGVTVNMLLPGRIGTDRVGQLDQAAAARTGSTIEEVGEKAKASIPAGRYGRPAEFGAVGAFLCSAPASYVTGTAVRCDGGMIRGL